MFKMVKVNKHFVSKDAHDFLKKYYDLDDENGICKVTFYFEKFTDFFNIKSLKKPLLDAEIKNKLDSLFLDIPKAYKFDFYIRINDYEGYSMQDAVDAFKDSIEFTLLRKKRSNKNKRALSLILLLSGIATLIVMIILKNYDFNYILEDIISEILDITAWVFIWEAVTIYLLDRSESNYKNRKIYKRINSITFE